MRLVFVVYCVCVCVLPLPSPAVAVPGEATNDFLSSLGITVLTPSTSFRKDHDALNLTEMRVSLADQQARGVVEAESIREDVLRMPHGTYLLLSENFEAPDFRYRWQMLAGEHGGWGRVAHRAASGSYSVWCAGHKDSDLSVQPYPDYHVTWLIAGPYSARGAEHAALTFYAWLRTQPERDFLFAGASADAETFYGYGASGDSQGWQLVHLNLNDLPERRRVTDSRQFWIGFMFVSDDQVNDLGVYLDDVQLWRDAAWVQEQEAVIDGARLAHAYSGGLGLTRPTFGDLDGDGDADLLVGEYDGNLNLFRNEGTPSEPDWVLVDSHDGAIDVGDNSTPALVDVDGDADLDLFVGNYYGTIHFFRNEGTVLQPVWSRAGLLKDAEGQVINAGSMSAPAFADVDADGDPDLFIGNADGLVALYRNDSGPLGMRWTLVSRSYLGADPGSLSVPHLADVDADGDFDLFVGYDGQHILFFRNQGTPEDSDFQLETRAFEAIETGGFAAPALADVDGDGDLDLVIGQGEGSLRLFRNQGTAEQFDFALEGASIGLQTVDVGYQSSPALADVDGDGDLDVVLGSADGRYHYYENVGEAARPVWRRTDGPFADLSVKAWSTAAFVDIDADGDLDLFSGSQLGRMSFFRNDGDRIAPAWTLVSDFYDSLNCGSQTFPSFADIDADGDYDLFVGTDVHGICFFQNVGDAANPVWERGAENYLSTRGVYRETPGFVDVGGDGDLDLVVGSQQGGLRFYENTGTPEKPEWALRSEDYLHHRPRLFSTPAFGDLDGDGDPDLLVGTNSGGLYFWRNLRADPGFVTPASAAASPVVLTRLPEPVKPGAEVRFDVLAETELTVRLYTLLGEPVVTLSNGTHKAGSHQLTWEGRDDTGALVRDGLYLLHFDLPRSSITRKFLFVR